MLALSACLVVVLLVQPVLPAAAASAAPARSAAPPAAFAPFQQDGGAIPPEEPAPPGEPLPDPDAPPEAQPPHDTPPPIAFDVQLAVSSLTIRPGQVVRAAFVVERRTAYELPWRVRFTLEQGLVTTDGRRMDIFFDMAAGEENSRLEREFDILLEDGVATETYPVKKIRVEAHAPGTACANSFAAYSVAYSYDQGHSSSNRSLGRLTGVAFSDGSYSRSLAYDASGRLKSETVAIAGAPASYTPATATTSTTGPLRSPTLTARWSPPATTAWGCRRS